MCMCEAVSAGACESQEMVLELELQAVVRHPAWMLGIRLGSRTRAASAKCCTISLRLHSLPKGETPTPEKGRNFPEFPRLQEKFAKVNF